MDFEAIKQKIINGEMTNEELSKLFVNKPVNTRKQKSTFLSSILKGFIDGYVEPHFWKMILEISLIFTVVVAVVLLSFFGKIDATVTSVLLSLVLGFLFGKMK